MSSEQSNTDLLLHQAASQFYLGRLQEAASIAQQILKQDPYHADSFHLLGMVAKQQNQPDAARDYFSQAIIHNPNQALYHHNLGTLLMEQQQWSAAKERLERALRLNPDYADTHTNLGNIHFIIGAHKEAILHYQNALQRNPNQPTAFYNLGIIFQTYRQHLSAVRYFEAALKANPSYAEAHMGIAFSWLMLQDFEKGWESYEWRWRLAGIEPRQFNKPLWRGEEIAGKKLYVYAEQGFGDAIHFCRFLKILRQRGIITILEIRPELERLMVESDIADTVVIRPLDGETPDIDFDYHIALLSLPRVLQTRIDTIPDDVPYLKHDLKRTEKWQNRLDFLAKEKMGEAFSGLKVGINWSGEPTAAANVGRACRFLDMEPILINNPQCCFFSLQKGTPKAELLDHDIWKDKIINLEPELHDFAETASVMEKLDFFISTDTAVVHLAGALARPVWTILYSESEWRWLENRSDSPWYPSMRLFRQPLPKDWPTVMNEVAEALLHQNKLKA
ncbi:tetratricopeptide repeat protein [Magnetococcales bacterium HHB-1]